MPYTEGLIATLTRSLTTSLAQAGGRRLRRVLAEPEREQALARCCETGVVAMLQVATTEEPAEHDLLGDLLHSFFTSEELGPDVGRALEPLLRGQKLDRLELLELFEAAGYDPKTLPGLDFEQALLAFEGGFSAAAFEQPVLHGEIQAHLLFSQLGVQQQIRDQLRQLAGDLARARPGSVALQAGTIVAQRVTGQQIVIQGPLLQVLSGSATGPWEPHYLRTLISQCDPLDLSPIEETHPLGGAPGEGPAVRLSDVFTSLHLEAVQRLPSQSVHDALLRPEEAMVRRGHERRGEKEEKPVRVTALEAVAALPRLVVLGQPGGGKSTLVNHLATQLAKRRLGQAVGETELPGWPADARPLPVRILLRRFASWLPEKPGAELAGKVWDYLAHHLRQCGCGEVYDSLRRALLEGEGIVFFDGLDEVEESDARKRSLICKCIERFAAPLERCRVVVTCREYAYANDAAWRLPVEVFPQLTLALFELDQIGAFNAAWYRVIGPAKGWDSKRCEREAKQLTQAIEDWRHLYLLARSPLLLTLMARIHGRDGSLPNDRADLYERSVNLLLAKWENRLVREVDEGSTLAADRVLRLDLPVERLRSALQQVAYRAHERQETQEGEREDAADISREELRNLLGAQLGSFDQAELVIAYVQQRAGLLVAMDGGTYRFPHRTFQEYLTARWLLQQADCDERLRALVRRSLAWWREVFLLAAGAQRQTPKGVLDLVDQLVPVSVAESAPAPAALEQAALAAEAVVEAGLVARLELEKEPGRIGASITKLRGWLQGGMTAVGHANPRLRATCGAWLTRLGDLRPEVMTLDGMEFCRVTAGPFWMGDDKGREEEKPVHLAEHLGYDYWIGRYPVTVAQFRESLEMSGQEPSDPDALAGEANAPVGSVSWEEAQRFCAWLTARWQSVGWLAGGWRACLPTEAEWEKAARGGVEIPAAPHLSTVGSRIGPGAQGGLLKPNPEPRRRFPWQGGFDADRCNAGMCIGTTSAVGCFVSGASPYGCEELSGNVWEWTRSCWGEDWQKPTFGYPYDPKDGREDANIANTLWVLRGGAFFNYEYDVRCSARYRDRPALRFNGVGFRVVLSPF